ncbi:MAG: anthranilate synthase component I [Rhodospirillales bacterium]|nr:anthranilate synthase component I [Rhodospirillales bacterium]
MTVFPDFKVFREGYDGARPQVVWTTLVADLETPVSAMLKLAEGRSNSFLLESVEGGAIRGRYSFIGLNPDVIWRCFGNRAEINRTVANDGGSFQPCPIAEKSGSLDSLRGLVAESRIELPDDMPPMAAGLVGYMAYDMVRLVETLPDNNPNTLDIPDSIFLRPTVIAVFDSLHDTVTVVTPVWRTDDVDAATAYAAAQQRLQAVVTDFDRPLPARAGQEDIQTEVPAPRSNCTREQFHAMVNKAVDYIKAGDAFQIVPSQRFSLPFALPPLALYRSLRRLNPSPFLFFLDFGGFSVVGSSPEILVRVRDGDITLRPLAGTRKRGANAEEDRMLSEELLADPKERAEHLMLLDLGRNDVGRVAKIGTVKPTEQFIVEYYSHVMHIASNVVGKLDDEKYDAIDALLAGFPAGTVSGAPKVRAMEIIDELETERRGVYAGCIGYFGADGDMDTCIALRTAVVKDGTVYIQAGGGVVADSDPEFEYQESLNKAQALIRATHEAVRFAVEGD